MAPRHPDRARAGSGGCAEPRDFAASRTPPAGRGGAGRERHVHTTVESFRSARPRGARAALEYLVRLRARAREGSMAPRFSGFTIQWLHGRRGSGTGPRRRDMRGAGRGGAGLRGVALDLVLEGAVLPPPALRRQWLQDSMAPRERALPLTPPCAPIPNKQTNTNTNKHKHRTRGGGGAGGAAGKREGAGGRGAHGAGRAAPSPVLAVRAVGRRA